MRKIIGWVVGILLLLSVPAQAQHRSWTLYYQQATAPATCSVGETWFDTDATAGSNWYGCTSANTWTSESGAAPSSGSSFTGGTNKYCLFNDAGTFGQDAGCQYDKATDILTLTGGLTVSAGNVSVTTTATTGSHLYLSTGSSPPAVSSGIQSAFTSTAAAMAEWVSSSAVDTNIRIRNTSTGGRAYYLNSTGQNIGAGQMWIGEIGGNNALKIDAPNGTVQLGADAASPQAWKLYGSGGSGTDKAGANLTLYAGPSTGTGAGGSLILQYAPTGGSTGSSQNAPVTAYTLGTAGNLVGSASRWFASTQHSVTCADSGDANPGTLTINPTGNVVAITNSDANGCTITLGETDTLTGRFPVVFVVVSNAGGTVDFADTAGVTELSAAFNAAIADTITMVYANSAWHETGRSNN